MQFSCPEVHLQLAGVFLVYVSAQSCAQGPTWDVVPNVLPRPVLWLLGCPTLSRTGDMVWVSALHLGELGDRTGEAGVQVGHVCAVFGCLL